MTNIENTSLVLNKVTDIFAGWYSAYADDQKISLSEALAQLPALVGIPSIIEAARGIPAEALDLDSYNDEERDILVQGVAARLPAVLKARARQLTAVLLEWILHTVTVTSTMLKAFSDETGLPAPPVIAAKALLPDATTVPSAALTASQAEVSRLRSVLAQKESQDAPKPKGKRGK
jgi:hypothetical protein